MDKQLNFVVMVIANKHEAHSVEYGVVSTMVPFSSDISNNFDTGQFFSSHKMTCDRLHISTNQYAGSDATSHYLCKTAHYLCTIFTSHAFQLSQDIWQIFASSHPCFCIAPNKEASVVSRSPLFILQAQEGVGHFHVIPRIHTTDAGKNVGSYRPLHRLHDENSFWYKPTIS